MKELLESYLGKGHWVFTDNYYTGVELYEDLFRNNTYAAGTIQTNRKNFPCVLKEKRKLNVGEYHFATSENLLAVLWHDRRDVFLLSTAHNQSVTSVMKRPKGSREKVSVPCPTCVQDYNMYMGGVDLSDQHLSYYSLTQRRTLKWWKKVFWRMIDISILNAWIIFKANFPNSAIDSHRAFRIELIHQLVQPLLSLKASPENPLSYSSKGRKPTTTEKRLTGKHFAYKQKKRGRCVVCYNEKTAEGRRKDKKTMSYCPKCEVFLCIGLCFESYHTLSKY